jgi:hypothetical protein
MHSTGAAHAAPSELAATHTLVPSQNEPAAQSPLSAQVIGHIALEPSHK